MDEDAVELDYEPSDPGDKEQVAEVECEELISENGDGEVEESPIEEVVDDDLEEGELTDDDETQPAVIKPIRVQAPPESIIHNKPSPITSPLGSPLESTIHNVPREPGLCKFFMRGNCTWGDGCKFLHPHGGNRPPPMPPYMMGRPPRPRMENMPPRYPERDIRMMHPPMRWAGPPPIHRLPPPPIAPELNDEGAWERGLREAKELLKKARGDQIDGGSEPPTRRMSIDNEHQIQVDYQRQYSAPHPQPTFKEKPVVKLAQRAPPVHELLPRTPSPVKCRSRSPATPGPEILHTHMQLERISPPFDESYHSHEAYLRSEAGGNFDDLERQGVLPPPPAKPNHNYPPPKIFKGTSQGPLQRTHSDRERGERKYRKSVTESQHVPPVHHLPNRRPRRDSERDRHHRPQRDTQRDVGRPLPYERPHRSPDPWKDPWDRRRDKKRKSGSHSTNSRSRSSSVSARARAVSLSSSSSGDKSRASSTERSPARVKGSVHRNSRRSVASKAQAKALQRPPSPGDLYLNCLRKSLEELSSSSSGASPEPIEGLQDMSPARKLPPADPQPSQSTDSRKPFKMSMIAKNSVRLSLGCVDGENVSEIVEENVKPEKTKKKKMKRDKEELLKQLKAVESAIAKKRESEQRTVVQACPN